MVRSNAAIPVGHTRVTANLTDDEIAVINASRSPSEKLKPMKFCGARKSTSGTCEQPAGMGTQHQGWGYCKTHGGNSEAGVKHAAHLMGLDIIERQRDRIQKFGGDRNDPSISNITAEQALLEEVRRSVAMVRWLEEMIGQWDYQDEIAAGATGVKDAIEEYVNGQDLKGLPRLVTETAKGIATTTDKAEWLKIYREERSESAKVAKMCIDAGIAHRMVSIAEDQGRILATALRAVLNLLALTPAQVAAVPLVVPPVLRAVAADMPLPEVTAHLATLPEVLALSRANGNEIETAERVG